ncbi:hypothetical protein MAC_05188 [Metarhizium acridum CQMa 102]|uniref:Uncharacterized protein n=1 Tax=Metarhizium acridum (strain CQMa 102) TaxID=655827 RepID=E9E5P0_METAQ|nr:uncharacterized protein MAC_05188 [Metarhizium acridum CQMa 102]EFY88753.1 hypothetical protein MAC_05188 [Metarhizium acridum CQMa 102]
MTANSLFVVNLERLCSEQDRPHILPIQYSYDWIKDTAPYVKPFSLKLNNYMRSVSTDGYNIPGALETHALLDENSITLDPVAGGFPWPTSIRCVRQNIHWQASVDGYTNNLRAFIEDKTAQRTPSPGAFTIADMARKELLVCWNSAKFSIGSNLDLREPRLARFVRIFSDHMLQSNDIASYDKEMRYWREGKAKQFLTTNGVVILANLLSTSGDDAAKAVAYAYQMEKERQIDAELGALLSGDFSAQEWRLICAMLYCVTGNMISAVTMNRYSGDESKLPDGVIKPA